MSARQRYVDAGEVARAEWITEAISQIEKGE
jgi:hypothetical protein